MKRLFLVLICIFLGGCYSDQKQQLSKCGLLAKQRIHSSQSSEADYIELCMGAQGYEVAQEHCPTLLRTDLIQKPSYYASLSDEQKQKQDLETGRKIVLLEQIQKLEPACYEPMSWTGKQTLKLEKWLGRAP